jgi:oxygen-dependent protoporphyrinogen oxidase
VPRKENRKCLAISYSSNKYPGRVPDDQILLRLFFGGALAPEMVDLDSEELIRIANQELVEILGWSGQQACWQRVIRWRNAMPQYTIGHVDRVRKLEAMLESLPTLGLCGAAYRGVGIPQCVRGGRNAARKVMQALSS